MLKQQRTRNNVDFGKFSLTSNTLEIETFYRGKLDLSHLFHLNGEMVNVIITNNNGISASLSSSNVTLKSLSDNVKHTILTHSDLKFYRDGTQVFTDILPYDVDLTLTFDKSNLEDTFINHSVGSHTDVNITDPQDGDVLTYDTNTNTFVNAPPVSVSTDNTTILGNGTAGSALTVAPKVVPYYHGQWQCGSVTYNVNTPPTPGAGTFYFQHTTIYPNTYEMIINYTDLSAVNHTAEFEKLDYSSIIQIYSTDKTLKNKYIISQYVSIDGSTRKYYIDALQSSEEFTLVMMDSYQFDIVFYPVQDIDDLRNVAISNPINNQVLTYNGTDWINKVPGKAMMTVGWFANNADNYIVDTNYYFPYSAYGATLSLIGTSFSEVLASNITNILSSDRGTNKCGIKNISGGTKQFLVMGKVSGAITNQTWVGFGVNDKFAVQIRQSRSNSLCLTNGTLTNNFHCIVDIPNQDGVYIVGCTHANYDVRFNLFNIWLTVIEI